MATMIPDVLYIRVGLGGAAVGAGTAGNPGGLSYISIAPDTNAANLLLVSGNVAAQGGGAGAGAGTATAGAGSTIATTALCLFSSLGVVTFLAGGIGAAGGGVNAAGSSSTALATGFTCGGAGGGGVTATNRAGGDVTGAGPLVTIAGGAAGSNPGGPGYNLWAPMCFTGGSGGGSSNNTAGGAGGDAGQGSGGGGGGGGTTGGGGGAGGTGLIAIAGI
jgi:hypothetical protein